MGVASIGPDELPARRRCAYLGEEDTGGSTLVVLAGGVAVLLPPRVCPLEVMFDMYTPCKDNDVRRRHAMRRN